MGKQDFGPGYLKAEDLISGGKWQEATYTVTGVVAPNTIKAPDGKLIEHPMLEFAETPKKFILSSKTNKTLLKYETGAANGSESIGKRVTLYPVVGNWFGGTNETSQRIRITDNKPKPKIAPKNLGKDITGILISPTQSAAPSPAEQERIRQQELENNRGFVQ